MKPIRVQRKRTKGWNMPENTVYVGRPTKFGNPFKLGDWLFEIYSNEKAVALFEESLTFYPAGHRLVESIKSELKGKNLACFCPLDKPCHVDVLLKIANE